MVISQDINRGGPRPSSSRTILDAVRLSTSPRDTMSFPSFSSGFSTTRPTSRGKQVQNAHESSQMDSSSTLGQFSFAPAIQTTVVTTTTRTTTKFPPFVMRAPRSIHDLDPKLYPLATTSTPASLRTIRFELDGKPTVFREAEDATFALEQVSLRVPEVRPRTQC